MNTDIANSIAHKMLASGDLKMDTLYEHCFYLIKETKKPKYLDFYELNTEELKHPEIYLEQTVRHNNKWYFITTGKQYYKTIEEREKAPKIYIKQLYKERSQYGH